LSTDDDGDGNNVPFTTVQSSRLRRHKRQHNMSPSAGNQGGQLPPQAQSQSVRSNEPEQRRSRGMLMVGERREGGTHRLVAARKTVRKSVFYVDNFDSSVTEDMLTDFLLSDLDVEAITCHEVIPRKRYNDPDDAQFRRQMRKAFRLCIAEADTERLLVASKWPEYVCIAKWRFHDKDKDGGNEGQKRPRIDNAIGAVLGHTNAQAGRVITHPLLSSSVDQNRLASCTTQLTDSDTETVLKIPLVCSSSGGATSSATTTTAVVYAAVPISSSPNMSSAQQELQQQPADNSLVVASELVDNDNDNDVEEVMDQTIYVVDNGTV
jgi:hypothetical protein